MARLPLADGVYLDVNSWEIEADPRAPGVWNVSVSCVGRLQEPELQAAYDALGYVPGSGFRAGEEAEKNNEATGADMDKKPKFVMADDGSVVWNDNVQRVAVYTNGTVSCQFDPRDVHEALGVWIAHQDKLPPGWRWDGCAAKKISEFGALVNIEMSAGTAVARLFFGGHRRDELAEIVDVMGAVERRNSR